MTKQTIKTILVLILINHIFIAPACSWNWPWSKGAISGVVENDNDSKHISNVGIRIEETGDFVTSDSFGGFRIQNLSPRTYTLITRKAGFMQQRLMVSVQANEVASVTIRLKPQRPIYNTETWIQKASEQLHNLLDSQNIANQRIAMAFYKKNDIEYTDLPEMVLRFATAFNAHLGKNKNIIVVRNRHQANYLINELRSHHQLKHDFDPATVAQIGKKMGASIVIITTLLEKRLFFEPMINVTSVETQTYIPGLSLNGILLQKGL